jgi:hypothetical protein
VCVCVRGTSDLFCFIVRERGLWAAQLSFPLIYWYLPRYSILTHLYHHPHQHHHSQMPKNNKSKSQQQQKQPEQQQQQQVRLGRQPQWSVSEARVTSCRSDTIPSPMDAVMSPTDYVSVGGNSSSSSSSYGTGAGIANLDCETPTSTPETPFEGEATATDADEDEAEVEEETDATAEPTAEPDADQYSDVEKIEIEFVPAPSSSSNGAATAAVPTQEQEAPEWGGERPEEDDGYEIVASGSGSAQPQQGAPVARVESAGGGVSVSCEQSVPASGSSGSSSSSSSNPPPTPVPPSSQPAVMSPTTAKAAGTITEIGASATVKAKKTPTSKTTCFRYGFKAPEAELEPTQRDHMPLRVIGAGWGRTGTRSLKAALDILGIKTYHMVRAVSILDCVAPFPALLIT